MIRKPHPTKTLLLILTAKTSEQIELSDARQDFWEYWTEQEAVERERNALGYER